MFMEKIEELIRGEPPGFLPGQAISIQPLNTKTSINLTTPMGKATGIGMGLLFLLSKDGYKIERVEEVMEVAPLPAEYYAITLKQKEELEAKIRGIVTGLATAKGELELLEHDLRKYKEFMDYFEEMEEGIKKKIPEKVLKVNQTLRAIFIDQVDVHTGEEIALKRIVTRWPTIISDFMKLTDEDVFPEKIAEKLKVSMAEGVVLATKNKLYLEWRKLFRKTVEDRYTTIRSLVEAKRKSIEEMISNAKPVLLRYKRIRLIGETAAGREALLRMSWFKPAAQAISVEISKVWAWKSFLPPEIYKPTVEWRKVERPILKIKEIPIEFKNWLIDELGRKEVQEKKLEPKPELIKKLGKEKALKDKKYRILISPIGVEPLDRWAFYLIKKLEEHYKEEYKIEVKFTPDEILKLRSNLLSYLEKAEPSPYFKVIELKTTRIVARMPDGAEFEDITFDLRAKFESLNIMLVRQAEILLRDKIMERYIGDLLGETAKGRPIEEVIKEEYPMIKCLIAPPPKPLKIEIKAPPLTLWQTFQRIFPILRYAPYEVSFYDRVTGIYLREVARTAFVPYAKWIKTQAGVP